MIRLQLIRGATNLLRIDSLRNALTQAPVNNAVVTATLLDTQSNVELAGESWPITAQYEPGSNGRYYVVICEDIETTPGQLITVVVEADGGEGAKRPWRLQGIAVDDTEGGQVL
jgi:hypothetical protein